METGRFPLWAHGGAGSGHSRRGEMQWAAKLKSACLDLYSVIGSGPLTVTDAVTAPFCGTGNLALSSWSTSDRRVSCGSPAPDPPFFLVE